MGDKHVLTIPGRYKELKRVCAFVSDAAAQAGIPESDRFHIELACDEACTNIIEHAYGGEGIGDIVIRWRVDGNDFIVTLHDNGRSFNPNNVPKPTIPPKSNTAQSKDEIIRNLKAGGLGIYFMRKLMDDVQYHLDPESGNTLTLIKKIKS